MSTTATPRLPEPVGQDQARPGERDRAEQPQQAQRAQRPQHGHGDDEEVEEVAPDELRPGRGQVQLDEVLDQERGPDQVVDRVQGVGDGRANPGDQRHNQDGEPGHRQDRQRQVHRGGETVLRVLGLAKSVHT